MKLFFRYTLLSSYMTFEEQISLFGIADTCKIRISMLFLVCLFSQSQPLTDNKMLKHTLNILLCSQYKIFKVCLANFKHCTPKGQGKILYLSRNNLLGNSHSFEYSPPATSISMLQKDADFLYSIFLVFQLSANVYYQRMSKPLDSVKYRKNQNRKTP